MCLSNGLIRCAVSTIQRAAPNVVFESMSRPSVDSDKHSADIKCVTLSNEKKAAVEQNEELHSNILYNLNKNIQNSMNPR